jgi:hypothetical protein
MKFKAAAVATCCLLLIGFAAKPAAATTVTFDWSLTGPAASLGGVPVPASGTLTANVGTHGDQVMSITGTADGSTITGLTSFGAADNLLFPNSNGTSLLDGLGLSFVTASGLDVNIFGFYPIGTPVSGNAYGEIAGPGGFGVGTFAISATPLPPTWTMMLAGLAVAGFLVYRRQRQTVGPAAA